MIHRTSLITIVVQPFREHHFMGTIILVELIIDEWYCAFGPGCEVLEQNNPFQIN